ncbi:MAG: aromatic acid exporter family protein [Clostridiales bacterium]|nr:aromatic acid exporter family protein [Clostridiales bacterium]
MKRTRLPAIGQRMIKSAVTVLICMILYDLLDAGTVPFQASIAAMLCIQPYRAKSREAAFQRVAGILLGAVCGIAVDLLWLEVLAPLGAGSLIQAVVVSLGIVLTLYAAVLFHQSPAASYSCVIYLGIAMQFTTSDEPLRYVGDQLTATFFGLAVGLLVNACHLPRRKRRMTLFLVDLEKLLPNDNGKVTGYSRVVLNNLIEDGCNLSFTTVKTPGSVLESLEGIPLRQPVILMNGTAIYDPVRHVFLTKQEMTHDDAVLMRNLLRELGTDSFQALMSGNSVLMFYQKLTAGEQELYEATSSSPYRSYICHELPDDAEVAYLLVLDESAKVAAVKLELEKRGMAKRFRLYNYDSRDFPGYSYLKIYPKDAKPENMLDALRTETGFSDIQCIGDGLQGEHIVHALKAAYEPPVWKRH